MTRRFRPRLWPTLVALPVLGVLLGLGFWQVERGAWKHRLIAERTAALPQPPRELPRAADALQGLDFTRVRVRGTFDHARELHVLAPPRQARTGYEILTPLQVEGAERWVLVDRGFVPTDKKDPRSRAAGQVAGVV